MVQVNNKHCYEELRVARAGSGRTVMGENQDNPCTADPGIVLDFWDCFWETNLHFVHSASQRILRCFWLTRLPLCFFLTTVVHKTWYASCSYKSSGRGRFILMKWFHDRCYERTLLDKTSEKQWPSLFSHSFNYLISFKTFLSPNKHKMMILCSRFKTNQRGDWTGLQNA